MTIAERINKDFLAAFKAKEMTKKNFLGVIKGEIQSLAGNGKLPTDDNVLPIIKKMEKSITANLESGDESAKLAAEMEMTFLKPYLPELMGEDEIRTIINGFIDGGAQPNIGFLMGMFQKNHKGKADNKIVSKIINQVINEKAEV